MCQRPPRSQTGREPKEKNRRAKRKLPQRHRLIICGRVTVFPMWAEGSEQKQGWNGSLHPGDPFKINIIEDALLSPVFWIEAKWTVKDKIKRKCPSYPIYRISLPAKLSQHRRRIQQHDWGEDREKKNKKGGERVRTQRLVICQHTKSPIFTLEIEISLINMFI